MKDRFTTRMTAGSVVEHDGKILVIKEDISEYDPNAGIIISQPVGHVEDHESLIDAVIRETKEETGYTVKPTALIGIYLTRYKDSPAMRFSFACELMDEERVNIEDENVIEAFWLPIEKVKKLRAEYRPGSTTPTFDDYFAGKRYPIEILHYTDQTK